MEIHETKKADIVVLEPDGRLDTSTSRAFEDKIHEVLSAGERKFVVDLRELEYVSSAGLRVLLMLARRLQSKGGELILCSPTESVQEVLDISGFTRIFNIAPSQAEALKSINERSKSQQEPKKPAQEDSAEAKAEGDAPSATDAANGRAAKKPVDAPGKDQPDAKPPASTPTAAASETSGAPESSASSANSAKSPSPSKAKTGDAAKNKPTAAALSPKASIAVSILKGTPLPDLEAADPSEAQAAKDAKAPTPPATKPKQAEPPVPASPAPEEQSAKDTVEPPKKDLMESVSGGSSGAASAKAGFWSRLMGRS